MCGNVQSNNTDSDFESYQHQEEGDEKPGPENRQTNSNLGSGTSSNAAPSISGFPSDILYGLDDDSDIEPSYDPEEDSDVLLSDEDDILRQKKTKKKLPENESKLNVVGVSHVYLENTLHTIQVKRSRNIRIKNSGNKRVKADTKKLRVEGVFTDLFDSYCLLRANQVDFPVQAYSMIQFQQFFNKKDQCNTFCSYRTGNITEEAWHAHQKRKQDSRDEMEKDKRKAQLGNQFTIELDFQVVKLAPFIHTNAFYYKTKLACHNLTVYNLATKHASCYWFSEDQNNQLVALTFTSCLLDFLSRYCVTENKKPITIFLDGCTVQNRNEVMANALLNFSMLHNITVHQKFLEVEHTQIEVDSVNTCIERKLKNREIKVPRQIVNVPTVVDIRSIFYNPLRHIKVKLDHTESDWTDLPVRPKNDPHNIQISCIIYRTM
ncbi:unnamed protein product [Diabrotica balteata]|uniref:Uncharacterized protein n=1 Tax=Diabrotica balteata TaxID=107213 RepID=A0A9N9T1K4_DIABA|nr:unnamed protein product [Diabrotica balteata]